MNEQAFLIHSQRVQEDPFQHSHPTRFTHHIFDPVTRPPSLGRKNIKKGRTNVGNDWGGMSRDQKDLGHELSNKESLVPKNMNIE